MQASGRRFDPVWLHQVFRFAKDVEHGSRLRSKRRECSSYPTYHPGKRHKITRMLCMTCLFKNIVERRYDRPVWRLLLAGLLTLRKPRLTARCLSYLVKTGLSPVWVLLQSGYSNHAGNHHLLLVFSIPTDVVADCTGCGDDGDRNQVDCLPMKKALKSKGGAPLCCLSAGGHW